MFLSPRHYRTFLVILFTYVLDLIGYSIVFPVLAPLLLNPELHFFSSSASLSEKTTILGLLYAFFGIAQFIGAPAAGAWADHYGRYKTFLITIGVSVFGYAVMAVSLYLQSLPLLFTGRIITGFCSGNFSLAQSATADLTDEKNRTKAFGVLLGAGGLGFVVGPWVGGKLANPDWLSGSGAFIFAAIAALVNFAAVLFFFEETWTRKGKQAESSLLKTFKDIRLVFHQKNLRKILTTYLIFCIGWAAFLICSPTFFVQKFSLGADKIGDVFAYLSLIWFFNSIFLNKELIGHFSLPTLIRVGLFIAAIGVGVFVVPQSFSWPYWFIIPISTIGGSLAWINLGSLLSLRASANMQGRALGVSGSMWSLGQILAPLAIAPLAGWNVYSPLLIGAGAIGLAFLYFLTSYRE